VTIQKARTTQEREQGIVKILKKHLGEDTLLPDISPSVVATYRDQRLKTVSAYAVRLELALLSHLFVKALKEWELPIENPVNAIDRPKAPKGRIIFLKEPEAVRLLDECRKSRNKMLYPYVLILLHTGMRPSEAAGLRWSQIDLASRSLTLHLSCLNLCDIRPAASPCSNSKTIRLVQDYSAACREQTVNGGTAIDA